MTKGYMQIEEGKWIEPQHGKFIDQCCDCGLTHVMTFAVIDRKTREEITGVQVQFKLKIDRRRTAASRRKLKFAKDTD
jgi:Zn-finger protein